MAGKFITFEGGEGTGKSTQAQLLAEYLRLQDKDVLITREPGGTEGGELIRALLVSGDTQRWDPVAEVLLLYAARIDHWQKVILPALETGIWVICDRFADSTIAYQCYGRGVSKDFVTTLHHNVLKSAVPDCTFIFDLDPKVGIGRSLARHNSESRFEHMDPGFHEKMRQGYLEIARQDVKRCHIINADQAVATIHTQIVEHLHTCMLR